MCTPILGAQNLRFGRPDASTLVPLGQFGTLEHPLGPWEEQEGHVGVHNQIFNDFGMIQGPHFQSSLGSDFVLLGFDFRSLFAPKSESKSRQLNFLKRGLRFEGIAKTLF